MVNHEMEEYTNPRILVAFRRMEEENGAREGLEKKLNLSIILL